MKQKSNSTQERFLWVIFLDEVQSAERRDGLCDSEKIRW